jgi:hypothetical protein
MSDRKQREAKGFETKSAFRHTVMPGISSPIFLKTVPGATCLLRRAQDADPEPHLKLFADDDGVICLHVRPSDEADDVAKFVIECSADGRVTHYPLELRSSAEESRKMPFPARQRPARKKSATIRPALSEEERLRLSQEELRERGYPPRPNPQALAPFKTWLRAVSVPMTMVEPRLVTNTGVSHQPLQTTRGNWSGFELTFGLFSQVWGSWQVPYAIFGESNNADYSAFWVGMSDSEGNVDLVQAGTEQNIVNLDFFGKNWSFSSYYAWTEYLPTQQNEQVVIFFWVNPGDEMNVIIDTTGGFTANFHLTNYSTNQSVIT